MPNISQKELFELNPSEKLNLKAIKEFGLTSDFREVGYVLNDGRLLDLSGKREGGTAFMRSFDHREVCRAIEIGGKGISGNECMLFFERQGNIRFAMYGFGIRHGHVPETNISLNTFQEPTVKQISALREAIRFCKKEGGADECSFAYDVYYDNLHNGGRCKEGYVENASPKDVNLLLEDLRKCKIDEKRQVEWDA